MNCLLIASTIKEIAPFLHQHRKNGSRSDIDILITGIGLTATTYSLLKQVGLKRPSLVIQAGIAGCFDPNISLGSVVVVTQDAIADQGVTENKEWKTIFDMGLAKQNQFPFKKGRLINPGNKWERLAGLKAVRGISVNCITVSRQMTELYRKKFNPVVESMEGAAMHYVCLMENIPFLQLRSISNYIGERNKKKWAIGEAIQNLNKEIIRITNTFKLSNY